MENLQITARIELNPKRVDALKTLATKCVDRVRTEDPGTLQYDWFLREDDSECVVRETYRDSEAVLAHLENLGDLLEQLHEIGNLTVELYGSPSAELREAMRQADAEFYSYVDGL